MDSIPFSLDIYEGLGEVEGLIKTQDQKLVLEYRSKDAVFGVIKTDLKSIRISFEDVRLIQYNKGVFGGSVLLEVNDSSILEDMPGSEPGRIKIKLKRKNREQGRLFAERVARIISEYKLDHPDAELSDEDIGTLLS